MDTLITGIAIGIFATLLLDVWAYMVQASAGLPATNWAMIGRWVGHMPAGRFVHAAISRAQPIRMELALGWVTHYAIGVVYGVAYLWLMSSLMQAAPDLNSAVIFSLAMLVAPWLIMQPALGAGICASRTPRPWLARCQSVAAHTVFGIGLYLGWTWIKT